MLRADSSSVSNFAISTLIRMTNKGRAAQLLVLESNNTGLIQGRTGGPAMDPTAPLSRPGTAASNQCPGGWSVPSRTVLGNHRNAATKLRHDIRVGEDDVPAQPLLGSVPVRR